MRISRNLAYMFVNSNTFLLSVISTKSVFYIMLILSIYHFNMSVVQEKFIFLIIDVGKS